MIMTMVPATASRTVMRALNSGLAISASLAQAALEPLTWIIIIVIVIIIINNIIIINIII